jgi:norsolorinic acid ketoreductase
VRPGNTVIAAVRSVGSSESLKSLPTGDGSKLIIVGLDYKDPQGAKKAVEEIQSQGITCIDVVIANAAIAYDYSTVATVDFEVVKDHVEVNAYGPLLLFQAVLPLLEKASNPKFAALGTPMGSIGGMETRPFPGAAYGMSKAALHWVVRKVHFEHPNITAFVLDPGFVQTDMGNTGAKHVGFEKAFTTVEDSIKFLAPSVSIGFTHIGVLSLTQYRSTMPPRRNHQVTFLVSKDPTLLGS